jgi:signal transduction histidine kinase
MQLLERERAERQISDTLREMSALLVSSLQLDKTLSIILESLERLLKFDSAALMLLTPAGRLRMMAARGMPRAEVTMASAKEIETFPLDEAVLSSKKPLAIADIRRDWRWTPLKGTEYIRSWLGVPLLYHNKPLGLVTLDRAEVDPFTQEEIALAEAFAGHAAIALQNADLFSKVQTQQGRLRKLSNRVVAAQEDERRRISRELHDEMGQALTAIKLNLQMLLASPPPDEAALVERLNELVTLSNDSLQEVRRLAMDLRPTLLDDLGLVPTLNWYQTQFQKRCKTKLTLAVVPSLPRLSAETETALYRVAQEALTNISRHANAAHAEMSLSMDNEAIRFSIIDDGKGFPFDSDNRVDTHGVGLTSMLERIEALSGQLEISSSPGEGTCIFISIPNEIALNQF